VDTKTITFTNIPTYQYIGKGNRYPISRIFCGVITPIWVCDTEEKAIAFVADCNALAYHEAEITTLTVPVRANKKNNE
jgi:hypothetical protein